MSTTSQPASEIARDPTDIYGIVVVRNPTVCATCHQRIRDKTEIDVDESHDGLGTGNKPAAVLERAGDGELGYDAEDKDEYGALKDYATRTYCGECGRPAGTTPSDPQPLRAMLDRVPALVVALGREGLEPDVDTIYDVVRSLKQSDKYCSRDGDIWRTATALSLDGGGDCK